MRRTAQRIASMGIFRFTTKIVLVFLKFFSRVISNFKFKALIPNSGNSLCHYSTEIKFGENIEIGNYSRIGRDCCLSGMGSIKIGDHVTLSRGVIIETAALNLKEGLPYKHNSKPIVINDGVWLATNVIVLAGVTIGKNALVGAGVVVSKDVEENEIIVGSRNRVIS